MSALHAPDRFFSFLDYGPCPRRGKSRTLRWRASARARAFRIISRLSPLAARRERTDAGRT